MTDNAFEQLEKLCERVINAYEKLQDENDLLRDKCVVLTKEVNQLIEQQHSTADRISTLVEKIKEKHHE
jgi:hypothetical protein